MKSITIARANYSPYFKDNFKIREYEELSRLGLFQKAVESSPEILITNTDTNLNDLFEQDLLKKTKLIIHPNSGYDNISKGLIKELGIQVILGNSIRKEPVVNYCLSCLFERFKPVPWCTAWQSGREWNRPNLSEKSALIIGYGHIGKSLEQKLSQLLKNIYIHDPSENKIGLDKKEKADFIFICASLTESSRNMIDKVFLKSLKRNVAIINPARGKIINIDDLTDFLASSPDAMAYLDVFPKEPYPIENFNHLPNIKVSCHVAGVFDNIDEKIIDFERSVIDDYIQMSNSSFEQKYESLKLK